MGLPPGWYIDLGDDTKQRYWDGQHFTGPSEPRQPGTPKYSFKSDQTRTARRQRPERGMPVPGWVSPPSGPGTGDSAIVCPHCQERGHVRTERVERKKGVSGGKLTGAVFTGGLSMLATGLSRKELVTEARCGNCRAAWTF